VEPPPPHSVVGGRGAAGHQSVPAGSAACCGPAALPCFASAPSWLQALRPVICLSLPPIGTSCLGWRCGAQGVIGRSEPPLARGPSPGRAGVEARSLARSLSTPVPRRTKRRLMPMPRKPLPFTSRGAVADGSAARLGDWTLAERLGTARLQRTFHALGSAHEQLGRRRASAVQAPATGWRHHLCPVGANVGTKTAAPKYL
jgi:hypothetical protein